MTKQEERTCHFGDFVVPLDHRGKIKEGKKKHKYFEIAKE